MQMYTIYTYGLRELCLHIVTLTKKTNAKTKKKESSIYLEAHFYDHWVAQNTT
jgi:hypothetical protein